MPATYLLLPMMVIWYIIVKYMTNIKLLENNPNIRLSTINGPYKCQFFFYYIILVLMSSVANSRVYVMNILSCLDGWISIIPFHTRLELVTFHHVGYWYMLTDCVWILVNFSCSFLCCQNAWSYRNYVQNPQTHQPTH